MDMYEFLQNDQKLFFNAFQYAAIGMALIAPTGQWLMVNKALCSLIGYSEEELLSLTFQDITHQDDLNEDLQQIQKMLSGEIDTYQLEKRYIHKDGSIIHILLSVSLVRDCNNVPLYFISQIQNITDRKILESELVKQATEDMLTGVSNRRRFYDMAEREIIRGGRYNDPMVILMLDIDHFKRINDTFGHGVGDEALKRMAKACKNGLRSIDVFGRLGGEEFGALLVKADASLGRQVAERMRRSVEEIVLPTDQGLVRFTVSIGGVAFADNHQTLGYRLQQADEALYLSKSTGRNRVNLTDDLTLPEKVETLQTGFIRLEWNKAYECGSEVINEQHRNLFLYANSLLSAMISGQEKDICLQYIHDLIAGIREHFITEEQLIKAAGYPNYEEHKQIHRELNEKAEQMAKTLQAGQLNIAAVFQFLAVEVVKQHLLTEDRRYFSCFQK